MRAIGRAALALALAAPCACSSGGGDDGEPSGGASGWRIVRSDLDRVPLAIWSAPGGTVWIAGGGLAADVPSLLLRGDGRTFDEVTLGDGAGTETLWWIHGSSDDDVWTVGERGAAWHLAGGDWTRVPTGTGATLYGVWAASPSDAWAVGGTPAGGGDNDVLLHWDGGVWSAVEPPERLGVAFFKVWGSGPDDVFVVGQNGVALHRDATGWSEMDTGARTTIFTVHGAGDRVLAVGGPPATLLAWGGAAWQPRGLPSVASGTISGVFVAPDGTTFVAGERHQLFTLGADGSVRDDTDAVAFPGDFHSVWADGAGHALAVGGNYVALAHAGPRPRGVVARLGD